MSSSKIADEPQWLIAFCTNTTCGRSIFFKMSDRVISCTACSKSFAPDQLVRRSRHVNGPEATEEDKQALAHWLRSVLLTGTASGSPVAAASNKQDDMLGELRKQAATLESRGLQCVRKRGLCSFY